jgi:hypothetical protein
MTLSLEANSVATVFHQVLKLSVEVMTLPELFKRLISRPEVDKGKGGISYYRP